MDIWTLKPEAFYETSLYASLLSALLLALLFGREASKPRLNEVVTADRVIKKVAPKGFTLRFPQGMVAYCTYCDRYLEDAEQATRHQSGKRHTESAAGASVWHEFRPAAEAKKVPVQPTPGAEEEKKTLDPEWETVEAAKRKPKKARKQS